MGRAILHIGLHKTGTTMIQDTLAANAERLAGHGVVYPRLGRPSGHHGLACDWNPHLSPAFRFPGGAVGTLEALARAHGRSDRTLILSSEELSRADPTFRPDLRAIRRALAPFEEVRVICTLRAQWRFLQSVWLEMAKRHMPEPTPDALMREAIGTGCAQGLWADYTALYDHLREAFAPEEILLLDHASTSHAPEGLLGAVLQAAGGPDPSVLEPVADGRANISAPPLPAWAAARIADPWPATEDWLGITATALCQQFGPDAPSTLFTRAEREALTRHFAPLNARLAERVAPVQPDFAVTGAEAEEDLLHREVIGPGFWLLCCQAVFRGASHPAANGDVVPDEPGRG